VLTDSLWREVEQFLYCEARLLDESRFEEWLTLIAEDCRYVLPSRENRKTPAEGIHCGADDLPLVDDDKAFLAARVERLRSGFAHAEEPLSRTRRFVTNIEVLGGQPDTGLRVSSNVLIFQSRLEKTEKFYVGRRDDELVRLDGMLRLRRRTLTLDHVLLPRSVSILL
jgi:dibenzofuran dioxygenase beta subunit